MAIININRFIRRILSLIVLVIVPGMLYSQVLLNEIQARNNSTIADPDSSKYGDWIELYNVDLQQKDLSGWFLSDDTLELQKWQFPLSSYIDPQSHLLVWADKLDFGLHTNFKLSGSGEIVLLINPAGEIKDSISFGEQTIDLSFGRKGDGGEEWIFLSYPTPGTANPSEGKLAKLSDPIASVERGFYGGAQSITFISPEDGDVYYSTDGSNPYPGGTLFVGNPLVIAKTTALRFQAWKRDYLPSDIVTSTYFINESTTLPVFSIVTEPKNLWDLDEGMYTEGRNYVWPDGNFMQNWEKVAHAEFWDTDGSNPINQYGGIELSGGLSRTSSQKSMRFKAKGDLGPGKLKYKFFETKNIDAFEEVLLRSSGNDWGWTMMADGMMQSIVANRLDVDWQAYQPGIMFLNGEYWGIHNIRERIAPDYILDNYGLGKNEIDFVAGGYDAKAGSVDEYVALERYIASHDLSVQENYDYVTTQIDIPAYINYLVVEIYYGNVDWPGSNTKCWRKNDGTGKWRWILYDLDWGLLTSTYNAFETATDPDWQYENTVVLIGLMDNQGFSEQFRKAMIYHMNTTFSAAHVAHVIDSVQNIIRPEMQRHIDRWYGEHGFTFYHESTGMWEQPWIEDMATWENNVHNIRAIALTRGEYVLEQMKDFFGKPETFTLDLDIEPPGAGVIYFDSFGLVHNKTTWNDLGPQTPQIQAISLSGYSFSHWEITNADFINGETAALVAKHSEWKYWDKGSLPAVNWQQTDYNDQAWKSGNGALGYGHGYISTEVDFGADENNKYVTTYFRKEINVTDKNQFIPVSVNVQRDDGVVVYLNGQEIARMNIGPGAVSYGTLASSGVSGNDDQVYYNVALNGISLRNGKNVLAAEVHQVTPGSSDLTFDMDLMVEVQYSDGQTTNSSDAVLHRSFTGKNQLVAVFDDNAYLPDLVINEVMPINYDYYADETGSFKDWVEVYNPGGERILINGFYFTDDFTQPKKHKVSIADPVPITIGAGEYRLFWADAKSSFGYDHLGFRLTGGGEQIGLGCEVDGEFQWIDTMSFPVLERNQSFGRKTDVSDTLVVFKVYPTPGASNRADPDTVDIPVNVPFVLYKNAPNPFRESTSIRFDVAKPQRLEITIFDMKGYPVRKLMDA
ncbi:MAG: CotH kinase family protein, partial [Bacteroidales bacterium]|nr:CotH kinase family protein [Bacteroidales bacterium]